jgi:hypothetical protein
VDERGDACSTIEEEEKRIEVVGGKGSGKEAARKTKT